MNHTQGKWTAGVATIGGKECFVVGLLETTKIMAVAGYVGAADEDESIANAYRIEACINACDGISTEKLNGGWIDTVINPYATRLEDEAKVLRDLLNLSSAPLMACTDFMDEHETTLLNVLLWKIEAALRSGPENNDQLAINTVAKEKDT